MFNVDERALRADTVASCIFSSQFKVKCCDLVVEKFDLYLTASGGGIKILQ